MFSPVSGQDLSTNIQISIYALQKNMYICPIMDANAFINLATSSGTITGDFDFTYDKTAALMDRNFDGKKFVDCKILGGDFASGSFTNCIFENVLFRESALVGVNFDNCHFINCKLSKVETDFILKNCRIDSFTVAMDY